MVGVEPRTEPLPDRPTPSSRALMVVDVVALVAFVVTGAVSHHDAGFVRVLVRNIVPLGTAWVLAALVVGTYRRRSWASLLATWAIAVPVGLLVRSWWVGDTIGSQLVTFLLVGSGFTLLYLVVGRALLLAAARLRVREHAA